MMGFEQENINLDILKRRGKYRAQVFQKFNSQKLTPGKLRLISFLMSNRLLPFAVSG
jgi:hypothetical protein